MPPVNQRPSPGSTPWVGYPYGYGFGFEYRSSISIGGWPLVHIASGVDPETLRPRVAKGVIAIGSIAVGLLAIGGVAAGAFTIGGVSCGVLAAVGGVAIGAGVSLGGVALGSFAMGGVAIGLVAAIGGVALGPSVVSAVRCDEAARAAVERWLHAALPRCR